MKSRILGLWERLRTSFWFLPMLMTIGAAILAIASVAVDRAIPRSSAEALGWAYTGGAEGASVVLGTVAGSMITIAGVVFSMTLVALSLASTQLGPRLLRNFMRDTATQAVLGTFIASFVYCLLVLRTIRRADETLFVPHLSVTAGVVLAVAALGVLIYFIHHVAVSIQADEIVGRVAQELFDGIDRAFPEAAAAEADSAMAEPAGVAGMAETETANANAPKASLPAPEAAGVPIPSSRDGYVQLLDIESLAAIATRLDAIVRIERRPGHYVARGQALATIWSARPPEDDVARRVDAAFTVGAHRTAVQDVEYSIHQLVEIAVRALSPGVNDPFTAITCVDRLGSAMRRVAARDAASGALRDAEGRLRVIVPVLDFAALADAAFLDIRRYAAGSPAVLIRLLESIAVVAGGVRRPEDAAALRRHAGMVVAASRRGVDEPRDHAVVEERFDAVVRALAPRAGT